MNATGLTENGTNNRRHFLGFAAMSLAAAKFGLIDWANAQDSQPSAAAEAAIKTGTNTSFASLKQIDAGLLNVGYAEAGPSDGPVAILLHGWPYDIHSYVDVAPLLSSAGYRVIVPYLRGYGTTRFLSEKTVRKRRGFEWRLLMTNESRELTLLFRPALRQGPESVKLHIRPAPRHSPDSINVRILTAKEIVEHNNLIGAERDARRAQFEAEVLARAKKDAAEWVERYGHLPELAKITKAMKEVLGRD